MATLKLIRTDSDELYINDGEIILARWVMDSHNESVIIRDAYGGLIVRHKISADNPIETDQGDRDNAADVIGDIGSNWRADGLAGYYQYVITGKTDEIVWDETEQLWGYENQGTGDVDLYIKNTPVATLDGGITIGFTDLTGRSIVDSEGTGTPTINGNNIEITAGYLNYFELDDGEKFYLQNTKGDKIYGTLGSIGTLSSITGVWGTSRNDVTPYGLMLGGSLFQNDTDDEYLRIVGVDVTTIIGYTKIDYYAANCGIWDTGNTYLEPDDAGLNAVFDEYAPDLKNPNDITHAYLESLTGRPFLETIQDVSLLTPVLDNGKYKYLDTSLFKNNIDIVNLQSARIPADVGAVVNYPFSNFTGVDTIRAINKFIWTDTGIAYIPSFGGASAASNGFYCKINQLSIGTMIIGVSNGVSNTEITIPFSSFDKPLDGSVAKLDTIFTLNGTLSVKLNDVEIHSEKISLGGAFGICSVHRVISGIGITDAYMIYSEVVGYGKYHYKAGSGQYVFDVSGNGNDLFVNALFLKWDSYFGDYPAEYFNGFTNNSGLIVLGLDDGTEDAQGNEIQYPANVGIHDGLSIKYRVPTDPDYNEVVPQGDSTWQELHDLVNSTNLIKVQDAESISNIIVKVEDAYVITEGCINIIYDGPYTSHANALSICLEYGYLPSFALITSWLNDELESFYKESYYLGCSIQSHSDVWQPMNDPNTITYEEVEEQVLVSNSKLEALGFDVKGWVTPGSSLHPSFLPIIEENYEYGYTGLNGGKYDATVPKTQMGRYSLESNIDPEDHNIDVIKARIDEVIANNESLSMYSHEQPSAYLDNHGLSRLNDADLRAILDYLALKQTTTNLKVISTDRAIDQSYYDKVKDQPKEYKEDFQITIGKCIKKIAIQPFESVTQDGEVVTQDGEKVTYLKTNLIT